MDRDATKMAEEYEAEFTALHRNIEKTPTSGTIHTEQLLSTDRKPQTSEKTRKPPCNWVGQKEKEKEEIRTGSVPQGGSCEGGKVPAPWVGSSSAEKLDWIDGEFWRQNGESSEYLESKTDSNLHRRSAPPLCASQPETPLCQ